MYFDDQWYWWYYPVVIMQSACVYCLLGRVCSSSETESEAGDLLEQQFEELNNKLTSATDPTGYLRMVSRNNLFNRCEVVFLFSYASGLWLYGWHCWSATLACSSHSILYICSWSPEDELYWIWWSPDVSSRATHNFLLFVQYFGFNNYKNNHISH